MAQLVKNPPAMWETWVQSLGWEDPIEKETATHSSYSGLENSMDCIVHGVTKSRTQLRDFHFHFTYRVSKGEERDNTAYTIFENNLKMQLRKQFHL